VLSKQNIIRIIDAVTYRLDPASLADAPPGARLNRVPASDSNHIFFMIDSGSGWSAQLLVPEDSSLGQQEQHSLQLWSAGQLVLSLVYNGLDEIETLFYLPGEWEDRFFINKPKVDRR